MYVCMYVGMYVATFSFMMLARMTSFLKIRVKYGLSCYIILEWRHIADIVTGMYVVTFSFMMLARMTSFLKIGPMLMWLTGIGGLHSSRRNYWEKKRGEQGEEGKWKMLTWEGKG